MLSNPYVLFPTLAVLTSLVYATTRKWRIRRAIRKELAKYPLSYFDSDDTQTVHRMKWSK